MERRRSTTPQAAVWRWEMMRRAASRAVELGFKRTGWGCFFVDSMPSILLGHD